MTNTAYSLSATLFVVLAANSAQAAETWDMPTAYPASNFHSINAQEFSSCVGKGTNGDITIVMHPNGSLFKGNSIKRAVQTGQVQIGESLLSSHENENPIFGADTIPFLATSYDDSVRLFNATRPELEKVLAAQGLKLVYSVPWPANGMYFNKEVNSIADMTGIKVRTYSKSSARLASLTGMTPVSIEAAEISQGMAAGVISSLITSSVTGKDSKVWEQLGYFYDVRAWLPRNAVIVNLATWNGLSKDNQAAVQDCAAKAEANGLEKSKAANEEAVAALQQNGVKVVQPSDQLKTELAKIGQNILKEWTDAAGPAGAAIMERYQKTN